MLPVFFFFLFLRPFPITFWIIRHWGERCKILFYLILLTLKIRLVETDSVIRLVLRFFFIGFPARIYDVTGSHCWQGERSHGFFFFFFSRWNNWAGPSVGFDLPFFSPSFVSGFFFFYFSSSRGSCDVKELMRILFLFLRAPRRLLLLLLLLG